MSGKKPRMNTTFAEAVTHKTRAASTLLGAGIMARFNVVVADSGPRVDVFVASKDLQKARDLLPPGIDPVTVQVLVWIDKPAGK